MPWYFFDVDDGERRTVDRDGYEMASPAEMRREAIGALPAIAADAQPDCDHRVFQIRVRDEGGRLVFHASLTLAAGWLV